MHKHYVKMFNSGLTRRKKYENHRQKEGGPVVEGVSKIGFLSKLTDSNGTSVTKHER